jgi:hypothetical protein
MGDATGLSFENARDELGKLIRQEALVLKIMKEKGYLGYREISNESNEGVLRKQLDHLRRQIAALREYCMIDSLDSLNAESRRLTDLTARLKTVTWILAALATVQIVLALFLRK